MSKEKKPQRASDSAHKSSRGASKRPASSSESQSGARKRNDKEARKRRKTEKAVRKASARASQRTKSSQSKTSKRNSTKRNSPSQSSQRKSSSSKTAQRNTSNQQRKKNSSPQPNKAAATRNRGASVRGTQNAATRKRPSQGASVRKGQPVKKRKLTAAEIAQLKRRRRLIIIAVLLLLLLILGLFTLYYVSNRIQDQSTVVLNDEQKSFAPIACTPEDVDVDMKVDVPLEEKSPITFTITLRNTSREHPCYIDVGRGNTELEITSGETSIVQLTKCDSAGEDYKQLLIDRDMTTTFEVKWNRHCGSECSAKSPIASPGTYHAVWSTKGKDALEAKGSFEIIAPLEPEPEESKDSEDSEGKPAKSPSEKPKAEQ